MTTTAETEDAIVRALATIRRLWPALMVESTGSGQAGGTDEVTALDRRISLRHEVTLNAKSVAVWDNWNAPGGASNTLRGLTRSSDSTREKAGMKPTGLLPTRPLNPEACRDLVSLDRWTSKVAPADNGCHVWTAATNATGYGWIGVGRSAFMAHRIAYVAARGVDIPTGYVIDHLCRNRACVNPDHLEAVTTRTNTLRGLAPAAIQAKRTECPRGHSLTTAAALRRDGHRECPICKKARDNERSEAVRQAQRALGLTQKAYRDAYGSSIATARRIIEESA